MSERKWRGESAFDVVNLVLGIGLMLTPWAFGFRAIEVASRNAWIAGGLIAAIALFALFAFAEWKEWVNLLLGLWVVISPWALGFDTSISAVATRTHGLLGLIVAVLAAVDIWMAHHVPPRRAA